MCKEDYTLKIVKKSESRSNHTEDEFEKEWDSLGINTNTSVYTVAELDRLFKKVSDMEWRRKHM